MKPPIVCVAAITVRDGTPKPDARNWQYTPNRTTVYAVPYITPPRRISPRRIDASLRRDDGRRRYAEPYIAPFRTWRPLTDRSAHDLVRTIYCK